MQKTCFLQRLKKALISKKKVALASMLLSLLLMGLPLFLITVSDYEAISQLHLVGNADEHDRLLPFEKKDPKVAEAYTLLMKSKQVLEKTFSQLALPFTVTELYGRIDVNYQESSHLLKIKVRHPDERLSMEIADTVALAGMEEISSKLKVDNILFISAEKSSLSSIFQELVLVSMAVAVFIAVLFPVLLLLLLEMRSTYSKLTDEGPEGSGELQTVFK